MRKRMIKLVEVYKIALTQFLHAWNILIIYPAQMALHSAYNSNFKGRIACGFPIIPFKTKLDGPANTPYQFINGEDIIDEAFRLFRINVLFKNFEIKGGADKVLIYLFVLLSHLFKSTDNLKDLGQIQKKLSEINALANPFPKDKGNFISNILEDGLANERDAYLQYIKQLKAETINRYLDRFYKDGLPIEDYKFWAGIAKKKFMGLNFVSLF